MPDGADADEEGDRRILEVMKANYGKTGVRIGLKWANDRFVQDEGSSPFDRVTTHDLDRVQSGLRPDSGYRVNEKADDWGGYIVAEILDLDIGQGLGCQAALSPAEPRPRRRADIPQHMGEERRAVHRRWGRPAPQADKVLQHATTEGGVMR